MMGALAIKLKLHGQVIHYLFASYSKRLMRLVKHFLQWAPVVKKTHLISHSLVEWVVDLLFYIGDLLFLPEVYELVFIIIKGGVRPISSEEKIIAKKYFGSALDLRFTKINAKMTKMARAKAHAFVSFHVIHYSKELSIPILIHELVHIWQFQRYGSVYIFRALMAQKSKEGYDYGGAEALYAGMLKNQKFTDYNFEQQGEIFEDYCRITQIPNPYLSPLVIASYEYFVNQVRKT